MNEQKPDEIAALKARIAELEANLSEALAEVADYSKAWEHYDETGIAPPRRCELEAVRKSGASLDALLAEFVQDEKAQRMEGAA